MSKFLADIFLSNWVKPLIALLPLWVYKKLKERHESKKVEQGTKFEFIQSFLKEDIKQKNRLVVEQAFLNYLGQNLDYEEIMVLLEQPNPTAAFSDFIKSKRYIAYDPNKKSFVLSNKYKESKLHKIFKLGERKWMKAVMRCHTLGYFIFGLCGVALLFYSYFLINFGGIIIIAPLVVTILSLFASSYLQLQESASLYFADKLINRLDKDAPKEIQPK